MQNDSSAVDIWEFKTYWMKRQYDDAIAADLRIRGYRDGLPAAALAGLRTAYREGGTHAYWTKLRELLLGKFASNPNGWYRLAEISTYLGDKNEALRWLTRAFPERPNWIAYIKADPTLDPLQTDRGFATLLNKMRLAPQRLRAPCI